MSSAAPIQTPDAPILLEIEPTLGCNLRCIMCHVPTQNAKPVYLDIDALEQSTEGLNNCHVIIGSEYEPTIHPQFEKLLRLIVKRNWKVDFLTNGVNLHKIDPGLLAEVPFHVFNASFDGFSESTFSRIRAGADYQKVKGNIIKAASHAKKNGAFIAINSTLLSSNLHETSNLVEMWNDEGFDLVRLLVMQARSTSPHILEESLYPQRLKLVSTFYDVAQLVSEKQLAIGVRSGYFGSPDFRPPRNVNIYRATIYSDNPNYRHVPLVRQSTQLVSQNTQTGEGHGMFRNCKSPFVYCRIRWDGNVDLCNNREFLVGNIYDRKVTDIWHGQKIQMQRKKIMSDQSICDRCDYFRFCIGSGSQDVLEIESHFAYGLVGSPAVTHLVNNDLK
jgi:radical SAM protein with 4Fe4S-binding SPASM domain